MSSAEELDRISARLHEIAERLRSPDLPEAESDGLAREAADLVAEAGNEVDRALRADDTGASDG